MKIRKITAVCIMVAMLAGLSGCGSQEPAAAENPGTEADEKATEITEPSQNEGMEIKAESGTQITDGQTEGEAILEPVSFVLYSSNDDATALVQETVEVDALTPENVLSVLVEHGILKDDIRILSLEEGEKDGQKVLNIDFSQEFGKYIASMGTTGEYMALGSVCNTFLSAYGCEKVKLTVEGGVLSTGHNDYPGYLGYFE